MSEKPIAGKVVRVGCKDRPEVTSLVYKHDPLQKDCFYLRSEDSNVVYIYDIITVNSPDANVPSEIGVGVQEISRVYFVVVGTVLPGKLSSIKLGMELLQNSELHNYVKIESPELRYRFADSVLRCPNSLVEMTNKLVKLCETVKTGDAERKTSEVNSDEDFTLRLLYRDNQKKAAKVV